LKKYVSGMDFSYLLKPPSLAILAPHCVRCSAGEHPCGTAAFQLW